MFVIANNVSTRRPQIRHLFQRIKDINWNPECVAVETLKDVVNRCIAAGADAIEIDIQHYFDVPEAMSLAVTFTQQITDKQFVLSTNNWEALEAGLGICKTPPIVNYFSIDESRISEMLTLAAKFNAEVILLVSDPSKPSNLEEMLGRTGVLIGIANRMGIPNEHIFVDPGIYHITQGYGQQHMADVMNFLQVLSDTFGSAVRTTGWLANASAGAPAGLRPVIETTLLATLSARGLSSVFLDVLRNENMRIVRLLKILQNEMIYAENELLLDPTKTESLKTYRLAKK